MNESLRGNIRIQQLTALEHFERCVVLQIEVWGYSDGDVVPRRVFVVAERIGGQVVGAFDGDTLVGFAMSLPHPVAQRGAARNADGQSASTSGASRSRAIAKVASTPSSRT